MKNNSISQILYLLLNDYEFESSQSYWRLLLLSSLGSVRLVEIYGS
jgi:hypothetical protein